MFYIIVGSITFIALILLIIAIYYNRFQFLIIKTEEAEKHVEIYLNKKLEYINRCIPIIKEELKLEKYLDEIDNIDFNKLNHFEIHEKLNKISRDLFSTIDSNDKLYKCEALVKVVNELNDNEIELIGTIKFYNDTIVDYNHLILSFPSNIIRLLFKYQKREFYSNEKREYFEILKEEKK